MAVPFLSAAALSALATGGMDAAGAFLDNCDLALICSAEPASYADAITNLGTGSGRRIGSVAIVPGDFVVSGTGLTRKVAFAGKAGGTVHVAGPANPTVFVFAESSTSTIHAMVTETGSSSFSAGDALTFPAINLVVFGALTSSI